MKREIIFYCFESGKCPVEEFLDSLTEKQFEKVAFVFDLIEELDIIPREYLKKLEGTQDLWEVRVQSGRDIFRFLGFLDEGTFVILAHAFAKKTQKIPKREIDLIERRKRDYFVRKR